MKLLLSIAGGVILAAVVLFGGWRLWRSHELAQVEEVARLLREKNEKRLALVEVVGEDASCSDGWCRASGTIHNGSDAPTARIRVRCEFYRPSGHEAVSDSVLIIKPLRPGGYTTFELSTRDPTGFASQYRCGVVGVTFG